jgi:hypothetical protein
MTPPSCKTHSFPMIRRKSGRSMLWVCPHPQCQESLTASAHRAALGKPLNMVVQAPLEWEQQAALFEWIKDHDYLHPRLELIHSIPNGAFVNPGTARKLQLTGQRAGVPDLLVPGRGCGQYANYIGNYIEMKQAGKKPTVKQREFHERLRELGYLVMSFDDWREARDMIVAYLGIG